MSRILICSGIVNWPSAERRTDRYGSLILLANWQEFTNDESKYVTPDESAAGQTGTLAVDVKETRKSPHIGDLARGIGPTMPEVGERIELGSGVLFFEPCDDVRAVGVKPGDGRKHDWMDPIKLYRALHQTVDLYFEPSA